MDRDTWRDTILHSCLESDTCVIYDRAAAWCEYDPEIIMHCSYRHCPQRVKIDYDPAAYQKTIEDNIRERLNSLRDAVIVRRDVK